MTQSKLRIVENENPDYPTTEQILLYYFDIFEARQLLGCEEHIITKHLRNGNAFGVKHGKKWYIRPDSISVLRRLIPHCRPNNPTESGTYIHDSLPFVGKSETVGLDT